MKGGGRGTCAVVLGHGRRDTAAIATCPSLHAYTVMASTTPKLKLLVSVTFKVAWTSPEFHINFYFLLIVDFPVYLNVDITTVVEMRERFHIRGYNLICTIKFIGFMLQVMTDYILRPVVVTDIYFLDCTNTLGDVQLMQLGGFLVLFYPPHPDYTSTTSAAARPVHLHFHVPYCSASHFSIYLPISSILKRCRERFSDPTVIFAGVTLGEGIN
ncbi:hypothetical protein MKW98_025130 [Papaver atlanticum]|uniref:Uncharacterized protein n=1 Tax=Papaver atlanticum TaxID=357466 RepID=A0AAD4X661_9MAGN|nr:hypothetical protein MKW98_025130 [Papaver atlanticum]